MFRPASRISPRLMLAGIGLACAASVGLALLAQHRLGMEPCPWCILQRILFVALAVLCLLASALPALARRVLAGLGLLLALGGMAAALWQHFVAAQSSSCALTLADRIITATGLDVRWPEAFEVRASCADAAVSVLGVPFELWSLALFALSGAVLLLNVLGRRRASIYR
ncbi:MAG: disulfide bond formation protein B [Proteobacteria bacterium]|uniref:disulfide bond formation protein B n=1 Tax=Aquabacterium sp. TaxID=1872578 RepID=UPI0035C78440|nr:disulfide bond formation protein B [Pseudomonadota bacterium]